MASVPGISTDQLSDDTHPLGSNIIKRGSFTVTLSTSNAVGVSGQTSVSLKAVSGNVLYPNVDVYRDASGATPFYRKAPYVVPDTNMAITESVYVDVAYDATGAVVDLICNMYSRTLTLNTVKTFYYVVYATQIAPSALDTASIANFNYN